MSFADLTAGLLGRATTLLGETVTYDPSGAALEVKAIFSEMERRFDEGGVPVRARRPNLGVRLSDFASTPAKGDRFLVRATTYKVTEVAEDGEGGATIYLSNV